LIEEPPSTDLPGLRDEPSTLQIRAPKLPSAEPIAEGCFVGDLEWIVIRNSDSHDYTIDADNSAQDHDGTSMAPPAVGIVVNIYIADGWAVDDPFDVGHRREFDEWQGYGVDAGGLLTTEFDSLRSSNRLPISNPLTLRLLPRSEPSSRSGGSKMFTQERMNTSSIEAGRGSRRRRRTQFAAALVLALATVGCGSGGGAGEDVPNTPPGPEQSGVAFVSAGSTASGSETRRVRLSVGSPLPSSTASPSGDGLVLGPIAVRP
jgi:hypothetical protein